MFCQDSFVVVIVLFLTLLTYLILLAYIVISGFVFLQDSCMYELLCLCGYTCFSCFAFPLIPFFPFILFLFHPIMFCLFYYQSFDDCLLSNERKKRGGFGWQGR